MTVPFGLWMAATMAGREVGGLSVPNLLSVRFAASFLTAAFVDLPIALWGGYFFGRTMGAIFRLPPRR